MAGDHARRRQESGVTQKDRASSGRERRRCAMNMTASAAIPTTATGTVSLARSREKRLGGSSSRNVLVSRSPSAAALRIAPAIRSSASARRVAVVTKSRTYSPTTSLPGRAELTLSSAMIVLPCSAGDQQPEKKADERGDPERREGLLLDRFKGGLLALLIIFAGVARQFGVARARVFLIRACLSGNVLSPTDPGILHGLADILDVLVEFRSRLVRIRHGHPPGSSSPKINGTLELRFPARGEAPPDRKSTRL